MAIVKLDKVTVYGPSQEKERVLDGLQGLGCLHLVNLQAGPKQQPELVSKKAREALRYLQTCSMQRGQRSRLAGYDRSKIIDEVLDIKRRVAKLREERDELQHAIEVLRPWGDFRLPEPAEVGVGGFWFYQVPTYQLSDWTAALPADVPWYLANQENQFSYVVLLAEEPPASLRMNPVELDPRPLSKLVSRLERVEEHLEQLHWQRVSLTRWCNLLRRDLDVADDRAALSAAAQSSFDDGELFAIQAWAPRATVEQVRALCAEHGVALTVEEPGPTDQPPTLLKNPERVAGAEGCVTFYITPAYQAWDPTTIVYFSFSLFFAMIVSDAGYGLVMAGLLLLSRRLIGTSPAAKRFRHLLTGIVVATIVYGVIVGSYFGLAPPTGSLLDRLQVKIDGAPMMNDQTTMMVLSVAIGVFHLVVANLISAWQHRATWQSLGRVGWALILSGGFLFGWASMEEQLTLQQTGGALFAIGALAVLLFSSEQSPITLSPWKHLRRVLDGVLQFANLSKAFGDSLSYLRLFALGLASAQLAITFNGLAADVSHGGGAGVLMALVILLVGHGINFILALMGGVVHGLRLNCIEFFNWSLQEEGYGFQPFRRKVVT